MQLGFLLQHLVSTIGASYNSCSQSCYLVSIPMWHLLLVLHNWSSTASAISVLLGGWIGMRIEFISVVLNFDSHRKAQHRRKFLFSTTGWALHGGRHLGCKWWVVCACRHRIWTGLVIRHQWFTSAEGIVCSKRIVCSRPIHLSFASPRDDEHLPIITKILTDLSFTRGEACHS